MTLERVMEVAIEGDGGGHRGVMEVAIEGDGGDPREGDGGGHRG